jgi:small subunit ribosomal protein S8
MPLSKQKVAIARLLKKEGYVSDYELCQENNKSLIIELKYHNGRPVIEMLKRVSRPGLRIYKSANEIPQVHGGLGVAFVSTSKGLMSDKVARSEGVGGEVILYVA